MTQIEKLYARITANPGQQISFRDFVAIIEAVGFGTQGLKAAIGRIDTPIVHAC